MKKKVAIVGTGFASWGAIIALKEESDLEIHVYDIGYTSAEHEWAQRPVFNAKKFLDSFFCYGVNDPNLPLKLETKRICSSHALGGHSTVYSGAILYPLDSDMVGWPKESIPSATDYEKILENLPIIHELDMLDTYFPAKPKQTDLSAEYSKFDNTSVVGMSRIAAYKTDSDENFKIQPFCLTEDFLNLISTGKITYKNKCYVLLVEACGDGVRLIYKKEGVTYFDYYDAIFLGAGCVNTTAIIDRSLDLSGTREYVIRAPESTIHAFWRMSCNASPSLELRRKNNLPEIFLEVRATGTGGCWSHTQLSSINEQIVEAICKRLPKFFHNAIKILKHFIYFAQSVRISEFKEAAILRSTIVKVNNLEAFQTVSIKEFPVRRNDELVSAVRLAVLNNWKSLKMIPIPFGGALADFFRGNQLGGWHFGGTVPMCENSSTTEPVCWPTGEFKAVKNLFLIDSSAFPTVPPSTVVLLTAAHAHRVASRWKKGSSDYEKCYAS